MYDFRYYVGYVVLVIILMVAFSFMSKLIAELNLAKTVKKYKKRGIIDRSISIKYISSKNQKGELLYPDLNKNFAYGYAACFDILSASEKSITIEPGKSAVISTGLILCLPFDLELQVRPKSGWSRKMIPVAFGTVDSDYRGDIGVTMYNLSEEPITICYGDKIAQGKIDRIVFSPKQGDSFERVETIDDFDDELRETERGAGGYGSSGVSLKYAY